MKLKSNNSKTLSYNYQPFKTFNFHFSFTNYQNAFCANLITKIHLKIIIYQYFHSLKKIIFYYPLIYLI